jgi:serine/threonine-protein kinase
MQNNEAPPNRLLNLEGVQLPRGNYYLEKLVSVSNMSVIYKAVDRSSQRHVAVKILLNERYYHRFKNEVDITWGQKNNIASAIRYDIEGERLSDGTLVRYLVMKWLSGPSLSDRIRAFRMESRSTKDLLEFSTRVLAKLAAALDEMHRIGIVHLDIKPSNILFNTDDFETDEPYIIDFGIAHWIRETQEDQTVIESDESETGDDKDAAAEPERPGTANYMPPEQWAGNVNSGATDQYALSITIYEILSGRVSPYQALLDIVATTTTGSSIRTGRREAWRKGHETEVPTPVHTYRPDLPRGVWDVLQKAMDKDPRKRYTTVGEFYRAYRDVAQQPLEVLPPPYSESERTKPENVAPSMSARVIPFILGAVSLLIIVGAIALLASNQQAANTTPTPAAIAALTETVEPSVTASPTVVTERPTVEATQAETELVALATQEATSTEEPATQRPTTTPSASVESTESATLRPTITPEPSDVVVDGETETIEPTATRRATRTTAPEPTETNAATRTRRTPSDTPTASRTPTFTRTPSDTPTRTFTPSRTPTRTPSPTSTHTPTPEPADALELLTLISNASRSANNFNCVEFISAYEELELGQETLGESERAIVEPLFERTSPLVALNQFCDNPQNHEDDSVQLPSNLASDEFRDLRTLIRSAIGDVTAVREDS